MQKKYIFQSYGKDFLSSENGQNWENKPKMKRNQKKQKKYIMVRTSYRAKMQKFEFNGGGSYTFFSLKKVYFENQKSIS